MSENAGRPETRPPDPYADPRARPAAERHAFRRAELPHEWITVALYDDATGLDDDDEREARARIAREFDDKGYRVTTVAGITDDEGDTPWEELDGRFNGLYAEGVTGEFQGVADDVLAADAARGLAAATPIDGVEYLLQKGEEVVWLPALWTPLLTAGTWNDDLWWHWNEDTVLACGPEAYDAWRRENHPTAGTGIRMLGRGAHQRKGRWNGVVADLAPWLSTNSSEADSPPRHAPELPPKIAELIDGPPDDAAEAGGAAKEAP